MIERILGNKIGSLSRKFPVLTLTGARQCGKSTLLRHCFPDYRYVSFEDPDIRAAALQDPRGFLANYGSRTFIDEAQHVPELFSYLQTVVDAVNEPGMYVLSGSHDFLLFERISQSLAGRCAVLHLTPLSIAELTSANLLPADMHTWLFTGGYPRVYSSAIDPIDFFPSYIQTYVERDVRLIRNITDHNAFVRFVKVCAGRIGTQLNLQSIAQDTEVSVPTIRDWLSILEMSHIIYLLKPHHQNFGKRLVKSPKIYFSDTGLVASLLGIKDSGQIATHYLRGNLFENMVVAEHVKSFLFQGMVPPLSYWRDNAQHEIDLIIERGSFLEVIEIKASATMRPSHFDGLRYFQGLSKTRAEHSTVVYAGDFDFQTGDGRYLSWRNIR